MHEERTRLNSFYTQKKFMKKLTDTSSAYEVKFGDRDLKYININQCGFVKYLKPCSLLGHGCKKPDETYIDEKNKIFFWIEKKNQNGSGSVSEKLQSVDFKIKNLKKNYPDYEPVYIFVLAEFFKTGHEAELEYLKDIGVPVFFADQLENVVKFIEMKSMESEATKALIDLSRS